MAIKTSLPNSFAFSSPFGGFWVEHFYALQGVHLFGEKVIRESDFRQKLEQSAHRPEIMLMGSFVVERAGILSLCRDLDINTVHGEDGFFPHYSTMHADPLGFCWESSLTRQTFAGCSDSQRRKARKARATWLDFKSQELPPQVSAPFVFWPLQLIGDKVNRWDLNIGNWCELLHHFRLSLPPEIQLVIKPHPRSNPNDLLGVEVWVDKSPNTVLVSSATHLKSLLQACNAAAGANSTVLSEARLLFHKPTYVYARGWFSNHTDLFMPVHSRQKPREIGRMDWVTDHATLRTEYLDDYTDWFLAQLLARQISHEEALSDWGAFQKRVQRLSYHSYLAHGEDIFHDLI